MLAAPTLDLYESEIRCPFNLSTAVVSSRGSMALSSGPSHLNHSRHASTLPQPLSSHQRAAPRRAGPQPRPGPAAFRVRAARPVPIPSPHRHRSSGEDPLPVDRRPTNEVLAHTGRELTCSNSPGLDSVLPDGADPRNRLDPSRKSPGRGRGRRSKPADAAGCQSSRRVTRVVMRTSASRVPKACSASRLWGQSRQWRRTPALVHRRSTKSLPFGSAPVVSTPRQWARARVVVRTERLLPQNTRTLQPSAMLGRQRQVHQSLHRPIGAQHRVRELEQPVAPNGQAVAEDPRKRDSSANRSHRPPCSTRLTIATFASSPVSLGRVQDHVKVVLPSRKHPDE